MAHKIIALIKNQHSILKFVFVFIFLFPLSALACTNEPIGAYVMQNLHKFVAYRFAHDPTANAENYKKQLKIQPASNIPRNRGIQETNNIKDDEGWGRFCDTLQIAFDNAVNDKKSRYSPQKTYQDIRNAQNELMNVTERSVPWRNMSVLSKKMNKGIVNLVYFDPKFSKVRPSDINLGMRCIAFSESKKIKKNNEIKKNKADWKPLK